MASVPDPRIPGAHTELSRCVCPGDAVTHIALWMTLLTLGVGLDAFWRTSQGKSEQS